MAGGRGCRISPVTAGVPKLMVKIGKMPILEHEIENLRRQDFTDIILTVCHYGVVIMDYFGDGSGISSATGEPFGIRIE